MTIALKPESFKQDSINLLQKTQSELNALLLRANQARISPVTDRELETAIALTGLKVVKFEQRLKVFVYHHGKIQDYIDMKEALDNFKLKHHELMDEFHEWLEDAKT